MKCSSLSVLAAALLAAPAAAQTPGFSTVVEFTGTTGLRLGGLPTSALMEHSDGNLYGTSSRGGTANFGTVYRLTKAGAFTSLRSMTGTVPGAAGFYPASTPEQHTDGVLYGVNEGNDSGITAGGYGNTFKITPGGAYTPLLVFGGTGSANRGNRPIAGLTAVGNDFYGTTDSGGFSTNHGTMFKFSAVTGVMTYLLDFTYTGASNRGSQPWGKLLNGGDGFLYGSTYGGGSQGFGTLFKYHIATNVLTTLVEFTGNASPFPGKYPADKLLLATDGNLYGTTINGGAFNAGTVFRLNPVTGAYAAIVEFSNNVGGSQGAGPYSGLVQGPDGYLYGTTEYLGPGSSGTGTIYRVSLAGQITPRLVDFTGTVAPHKGSHPWGGLLKTTEGIIYGTTLDGGDGNFGTIWKLNTSLLPQPPVVTTGTATSITGNGATLGGTINPRSLATAWQFEYGTTTAYGTSVPVPTGTLPAGTTDQPVSLAVSGLAANTLYHFRLKASSTAGFSTGTDGTFTTGTGSPQSPLVVTGAASAITASTATLAGTVNPRGNAATWQFEYGISNTYGSVFPSTPGTTGSGSTAESVGTTLTGLPAGTTIHYRLRATNTAGTTFGNDATFTTTGSPQSPVVVTGAASEITGTTAVLNATVNPRGSETSWRFAYGPDVSLGSFAPVTPASLGNGITPEAVSIPLIGLTPGTTVYFQILATNTVGTVGGSIGSFTTAIAPEAVTQAAVGITLSGATLVGTVDPNGSATSWQFDYGTTTSYGSVAPALPGTTGTGTVPETVAHNLTGLAPGTTIYYRLRATNGAGSDNGDDFSFTTKQPPTVVTGSVQNLSATGVTLTGTVNPHGFAATWQFDYGTTDSYGSVMPASAGTTGSGSAPENVSAVLTGLTPNTLYHFRLRSANANGNSFGPDFTLTTNNNLSGWRQQHFGTTSNTGSAADTFDADGDGVSNFLEYAYGMNPHAYDRHLLPVPGWNGSNLIASFVSPASVHDIRYGAQVSTNLTDWANLADGGTGLVHTFSAPVSPVGRNYMRLRVTLIP